jgi:serine/threonine protein kinase
MASTIESSALLRQRYLIKHLLGQGGFGRTYLALDRERFDEPCVLKEFTVSYQDETLVAKAKALFAREASILHQIQHPQIPRFWAAFEWEERLFLVQDYIQGSTYRALLKARRDSGKTLSEAEVLHLLNHLLPVLAYLHDRQIVHRDISPENIMLQPNHGLRPVYQGPVHQVSRDRFEGDDLTNDLTNDLTLGLPVLLDFGSVKEATSGLALVSSAMTRVGKVGYAPPEQLQTGNVKPHSDLYALAATCLVLLTGREPHSLLDSLTLDWHWQPYVRVSREFSNILNRMLALHPGDRYQSAQDVHRDLQRLLGVLAPMIHLPQLQPWQTLASPTPPTSAAFDAAATSARSPGGSRSTGAVLTAPTTILPRTHMQRPLGARLGWSGGRPVWAGLRRWVDGRWPTTRWPATRWAMTNWVPRLAVATSLLLTAGVGVSVFRTPMPTSQQVWQTPGPELGPVPPELPLPHGVRTHPPGIPQPIEFGAGGISAVEQGNLQDDQTQLYALRAVKGQIMSVMLEGSGVKMNLLRSNQRSIDNAARQTRSWSGQLPASEDYQIQITGSGAYSLDVTITPTGRPQEADTQRLALAASTTDARSAITVTGEVLPQQVRRYIVKLKAGQMFGFKVLQGDVKVSTIAPHGAVLGTNANRWQGKSAQAGDYIFEVSTQKREDYALSVELK